MPVAGDYSLNMRKTENAKELEVIKADGTLYIRESDGKSIFPWRIARGIASQINGTVRKPEK